MTKPGESKQNGRLSIPLPFEEAVRASLGVKPPPKPPKKQRAAKPKQPKG